MGDRISIGFKRGENKSVVFFSHWDGERMIDCVEEYLKELKNSYSGKIGHANNSMPLYRGRPDTVIIDFIRWFTKAMDKAIERNYYLGRDEFDGDNSDNGHFWFCLDTGEVVRVTNRWWNDEGVIEEVVGKIRW